MKKLSNPLSRPKKSSTRSNGSRGRGFGSVAAARRFQFQALLEPNEGDQLLRPLFKSNASNESCCLLKLETLSCSSNRRRVLLAEENPVKHNHANDQASQSTSTTSSFFKPHYTELETISEDRGDEDDKALLLSCSTDIPSNNKNFLNKSGSNPLAAQDLDREDDAFLEQILNVQESATSMHDNGHNNSSRSSRSTGTATTMSRTSDLSNEAAEDPSITDILEAVGQPPESEHTPVKTVEERRRSIQAMMYSQTSESESEDVHPADCTNGEEGSNDKDTDCNPFLLLSRLRNKKKDIRSIVGAETETYTSNNNQPDNYDQWIHITWESYDDDFSSPCPAMQHERYKCHQNDAITIEDSTIDQTSGTGSNSTSKLSTSPSDENCYTQKTPLSDVMQPLPSSHFVVQPRGSFADIIHPKDDTNDSDSFIGPSSCHSPFGHAPSSATNCIADTKDRNTAPKLNPTAGMARGSREASEVTDATEDDSMTALTEFTHEQDPGSHQQPTVHTTTNVFKACGNRNTSTLDFANHMNHQQCNSNATCNINASSCIFQPSSGIIGVVDRLEPTLLQISSMTTTGLDITKTQESRFSARRVTWNPVECVPLFQKSLTDVETLEKDSVVDAANQAKAMFIGCICGGVEDHSHEHMIIAKKGSLESLDHTYNENSRSQSRLFNFAARSYDRNHQPGDLVKWPSFGSSERDTVVGLQPDDKLEAQYDWKDNYGGGSPMHLEVLDGIPAVTAKKESNDDGSAIDSSTSMKPPRVTQTSRKFLLFNDQDAVLLQPFPMQPVKATDYGERPSQNEDKEITQCTLGPGFLQASDVRRQKTNDNERILKQRQKFEQIMAMAKMKASPPLPSLSSVRQQTEHQDNDRTTAEGVVPDAPFDMSSHGDVDKSPVEANGRASSPCGESITSTSTSTVCTANTKISDASRIQSFWNEQIASRFDGKSEPGHRDDGAEPGVTPLARRHSATTSSSRMGKNSSNDTSFVLSKIRALERHMIACDDPKAKLV